MRKRITRRAITALETPTAGQSWLYDTELPGFMVLCQSSGRKTYMARYKAPAGNWRKMTLGNCAELEPEAARERARDALAASRAGRDPVAEMESARQAPTVATLQARFMDQHASKLKAGTRRNYEILWRKHIMPRLGESARVADLKRGDVQRMHDAMRKTPHNANRALEVVSKAMNLAEVWGWRPEGTNPCRHVTANQEEHRQHTLTDSELRRLWAELDRIEEGRQVVPFAQTVKLLLLTGCRLDEWLGARWSWIDWERRLLCLPDSKTGARDVHLSDDAVAILLGLPRKHAHILPGETGGKIGGIQRAWRRIRTAAGIGDVRLHDLRHTVGSLGHRSGLTQRQIADLLGHRQMHTTARYINSADEHKRETVNAWGAEVSRVIGGK